MRRDIFQAIADPARRKIIHLLSIQPLNLNSIAGHFEMSRPAVSKHIRLLRDCGVVTVQQQGRERICKADFRKLQQVADWTAQYSAFWNSKLDDLENYLEKTQRTNRKKT